MKKLIEYFIDKTALVTMITLGITAVGIVALMGMKRDLHPPFKFNYVEITVNYPFGSADEIERSIAYPLEEVLRDVADLEEMKTRIRAGNLRITMKFPQSVKNMVEKNDDIRSRVQPVMRLLPPGVREFEIGNLNDNEIFVANLAVTGIDSHNWSHHAYLDNLKTKIRSVKGIITVNTTLNPYHLFVRFHRNKMDRAGVTVSHIRDAIQAELGTNVIGYSSINGKDWLLEYTRDPITPERISSLQIYANSTGQSLRIGDVADVKFDLERSDGYQFLLDGKKAIEVTVMKNETRDAMQTFDEVKKAIAEVKPPKGVDARVLYDGPYFIQQQISVLLSNGFGGLILVLIMLGLAMGWKTSLMTAIGLPISYFGTFLILRMAGVSIDLISLIAMILVVGNLVDDAVIFAERYNQLLTEGVDPRTAASRSAKELIVPVSGTILTIICAFIPIISVDSELSVIFLAIPIVVTAALVLSWFETFFILPNHLQHFVTKPAGEKATVFFHFLARGYKTVLTHVIKLRYVYGVASLVLLGFSIYTATKMPQDFSLSINAPQVEIFVKLKEGQSFEEVQNSLKPIHEKLLSIQKSQLDFIETNLGWVWFEGKIYRGSQYANIRLVLDKKETDVKSLRKTVFDEVQSLIGKYKSDKINELKIVESERGSSNRVSNQARLQIRGQDELSFMSAKKEAIALIANKKDIKDYVPPDEVGPQTYTFSLKPDLLRRYNISRDELAFQVQAQTTSVDLVETRDQGRWFKVFLEPATLAEPTLNQLKTLQLQSPTHLESFPLAQLGTWNLVGESEKIEHLNAERVLNLDFSFDGQKTNEQVIQNQLTALVKPLKEKFPRLTFEVVDSNEQDKAGREWTIKIVIAAAILIYLILAATLRSWFQPLIVGLPIPFALIGVIWALKLHGWSLGLMAMIGLIGTMGVAVNDSIVMVHHINLLSEKFGKLTRDIVINGAASRLRAIFLTASCTLVGVFPTAYGVGGESGFTQPLAFSMGWGLSASLLLTLFIIPAMIIIFEDLKSLRNKFLAKFKKDVRSTAPAEETKKPEIEFENPVSEVL